MIKTENYSNFDISKQFYFSINIKTKTRNSISSLDYITRESGSAVIPGSSVFRGSTVS